MVRNADESHGAENEFAKRKAVNELVLFLFQNVSQVPGTPRPTIYKWLFQLDDSKSLYGTWLFHQTSIYIWLFGVPGLDTPKPCQSFFFHEVRGRIWKECPYETKYLN